MITVISTEFIRRLSFAALLGASFTVTAAVAAQEDVRELPQQSPDAEVAENTEAPPEPQRSSAQPARGVNEPVVIIEPNRQDMFDDLTPMESLMLQVELLLDEMSELRKRLARAQLEAAEAKRELEELRQFIEDNEQLGRDFAQYQAVKAIAEREARQREAARRREQLEQQRQQEAEQRRKAMAQRQGQQQEDERYREFRDAGFSHIGLGVLVNQMAYAYYTNDDMRSRLDYVPGVGHYRRFYPGRDIDYSRMTISGSVLNAAEETRHIGVAIVFFDNVGNQVGNETVEVRNARPDVPYPFTATVDMALNRPFSSSSIYVLYADPIEPQQQSQQQQQP